GTRGDRRARRLVALDAGRGEARVTEPERALEQARATAAAMRADGAYGEDPQGGELAPADAPTPEKLFEWALIDPDLRQVRSTRSRPRRSSSAPTSAAGSGAAPTTRRGSRPLSTGR